MGKGRRGGGKDAEDCLCGVGKELVVATPRDLIVSEGGGLQLNLGGGERIKRGIKGIMD